MFSSACSLAITCCGLFIQLGSDSAKRPEVSEPPRVSEKCFLCSAWALDMLPGQLSQRVKVLLDLLARQFAALCMGHLWPLFVE